jgi:putative component of toxin-antitoxin plasmid stabilization module
MHDYIYYTKPNERQPAREWIEDRKNSTIRTSIYARLTRLSREGLALLDGKILVPIQETLHGKTIADYYELRHVGKKWRLAVYYERGKDVFVIIWGWRKDQKVQERDIAKALNLLAEYLSTREG